MSRLLPDEEIKNILRKWSVPEDIIESFGIAKEKDIAHAQDAKTLKAVVQWFMEQIDDDWVEKFDDSYGQRWVKVTAFFFEEDWQALLRGEPEG